MHFRPTRKSLAAVAAITVVAVATVAACGSNDEPEVTAEPTAASTPAETPTTTETPTSVLDMAGRAPLTGLPGDAAALNHAAVTVKISNTKDAHPHRGITDADLVFVEPIGVSATRIAAVFHSTLPAEVGPVRSLRVADAALIGPTHGVLANTMAAADVLAHIDSVADLDNRGTLRAKGTGAYRIDNSRKDPHRVFAQTAKFLELTNRTAPPAPYFSYGTSPEAVAAQAGAAPATNLHIDYSDITKSDWVYDAASGAYLRSEGGQPHVSQEGVQANATNVVVLRAAAGYAPVGGAESFTIQLENTAGDLTLLSGGKAIPGKWTKAGVNDPFVFTTTDGKPLLLNPGKTWVELPQLEVGVSIS